MICQRCLKKFSSAYNLKRHLQNNKKKCKIKGVNISNKKLLNDFKTSKSHKCNKCKKIFKYKKNFIKHNCYKTKGNINDLTKKLSEQREILNYLVNNNGKKVINNVNNTMNIMNQNNINITLNDFGNEDLSHINNQFILDIISKMNRSSLLKYIKAVHCDNPYNLNIFLPNKSQKLVLIWKNDKWILDNKKTVLDGMIVKNFDRINDIYEKIEKKLPKAIKEGYNDYADNFDKNDKERDEINKDTEYLLVNNTKNNLIGMS